MASSILQPDRAIRRSPLRLALCCLFLDGLGIGLCNPLLPKLIYQLLGDLPAAAAAFGWVSMLNALMLFLSSPIQGALSDRVGRKPVLLLAMVGTGLSQFLLAIAPNLTWIAIAQLLNGLTGACLAVIFTYLSDISSPDHRSRYFNWMGAVLGIAWVIAPVVGGVISVLGVRLPFVIAGSVTLVNGVYALAALPESHVPQPHASSGRWLNPLASVWQLYRSPNGRCLAGMLLCVELALQCFISTWVLFTVHKFHWSAVQAGLSLTLLGLSTALVQTGVIQPIMRRLGEKTMIRCSLAMTIISYGLYMVVEEPWMIYGAILLSGFNFAVKPMVQGVLSRQFSDQSQGKIQGALASQTAITAIVGSVVATQLFSLFVADGGLVYLPEIPFVLAVVLSVGALRLSYNMRRV